MRSGGTAPESVFGQDLFLDIIVDVPSLDDRRFTYRWTGDGVLPYGAKVRVPFGSAFADGFVVSRAQKPEGINVKDISFAYDTRFLPDREMLDFCGRLAGYYCVSLASMWSCLWPPVIPKMKGYVEPRPVGLEGPPERIVNGDALSQGEEELVWGSRRHRWARYLEVVKEELLRGKGSLVLVPETKEMGLAVSKLREVAGDLVTPVCSEMTGLSRREEWLQALIRPNPVVVGTRSAVFAGTSNLGAIIVDEEWSDSYKSPETPLYDARTVARHRAQYLGARLLLGSSHPSLWAYAMAREGALELRREPERPVSAEIVDLRASGPRREALSPALIERMKSAFEVGEKVFLFLNKRGEASQVICQDCGNTITCPLCGSPMVYHAKERKLVCHTCDRAEASPDRCPKCGGARWRFLGFGIEKAASEVARHFPEVPLYRLDKDTLASETVQETLSRFSMPGPACLLGTQLALGQLGFPQVRLVGVLSGDTILNLPDFRASERVFHTLRRLLDLGAYWEGEYEPAIVAQTYNPDHHSVRGLIDPDAFYEEELALRRSVGYPPFAALFKVGFSGKNHDKVKDLAREFSRLCGEAEPDIRVLGPIPSPKPKVRNQFRWQVALRHPDHLTLSRACRAALGKIRPASQVKITVDAEPVDMW
ncbi:MAG TPA: primosomal protein N' [Firmicutes bacterium]|nr:primosomal protein N' [Candidatus Fermentithermobacillaceae bacterium]